MSPIERASREPGTGFSMRAAATAGGLVPKPMFGRPQASRSFWPWSSKTPRPPTSMKSPSSQASIIRAWCSVSFASRSLSSSLRPLIPPASLHHAVNASALSKISWFRPGRPEKPGSETVPTWMESAVTPTSVASSVAPSGAGPHTFPRSPNSPRPGPVSDVDGAVVAPSGAVVPSPSVAASSERPHATATSAKTATTATRRLGARPLRAAARRCAVSGAWSLRSGCTMAGLLARGPPWPIAGL